MLIFPLILLFLLPILLLFSKSKKPLQQLPPGSLGLPVFGQSFALLCAMRSNSADQWISARAKRYGPVSKMSLFGRPKVFMYGQAANKFVFGGDGTKLSNQQTDSVRMILGARNLLELKGEDHRRVRNSLASFLKPDSSKNYVGRIEEEIRLHMETYWHGKETVTVLPLMKTLTFNIICSLLFGIERGAKRDALVEYFQQMIEGMWSIPINVPFTCFNRSLKASAKVQETLQDLICEKRVELKRGPLSNHEDLITCLLTIRGEDGKVLISEDEIIRNVMIIMVAGHDTSSTLITFIVRLLANDPSIHEAVLTEQERIKNEKPIKEPLTWEDLGKMKYTWRVAMEILRTIPPLFGGFRKAMEDIEYNGYLIPKGWQVFWVSSMTHIDGAIFPEPEKLDPDRFVNPASIPPYCYIPFGAGA